MNNWLVDFAVAEVKNNPEGLDSLITIDCLQQMPIPITIELTDINGKIRKVSLGVDTWMKWSKAIFAIGEKLSKVVIDPDGQIPDINLANNKWEAGE